jgi:molecular chaperone GrpE
MPDIPKPVEEAVEGDPSEGARSETPPDAAEIQRQRDEYYDLLLRTRAEFDNYRKRIDRERQESAAADAEGYRKGVELIHRQLLDLLRRRGVQPIDALGADFDPHVHQAVTYEPAPDRREGEVIEELRRGYMLGDRLLRPSMVKVAKVENS